MSYTVPPRAVVIPGRLLPLLGVDYAVLAGDTAAVIPSMRLSCTVSGVPNGTHADGRGVRHQTGLAPVCAGPAALGAGPADADYPPEPWAVQTISEEARDHRANRLC